MAAIRSTENRSEAALRSALFRLGLRFRKYAKNLPGHPDIVFVAARVAVFVDGDYWHARSVREEGVQWLKGRFKASTWRYWKNKFIRRIRRDDAVNEELAAAGWRVIRIWESDLKRDLDGPASRIAYTVRARSIPKSNRS